jgi:hypothetical protein
MERIARRFARGAPLVRPREAARPNTQKNELFDFKFGLVLLSPNKIL